MTVYDLKPKFQALLRPLSDNLHKRGFTPNMITLIALALSVFAGTLIALWPGAALPLILIPIVLLVRMGLNAIDGMIAREHDMKSDLGKYLNEVGDIVSDLALYLPILFVVQNGFAVWLFAIFLVGAVAAEVVGIMAEQMSGTRRYDGPMGKSDRAVLMSVFALYLAFFAQATFATIFFGLVCAIASWITVARRYRMSTGGAT